MPTHTPVRTGAKILLIFSLLLLAAVTFLIFKIRSQIDQFQAAARAKSRTCLKQGALESAAWRTRNVALAHDARFGQLADYVSAVAKQAGILLDQAEMYGKSYRVPLPERRGADALFGPDAGEPARLVYAGPPESVSRTPRHINALSHIDPLLADIKAAAPACRSVFVITESDFGWFYPAVSENLTAFQNPSGDLRGFSFYRAVTPENNPEGRTLWSPAVRAADNTEWIAAATCPILDENGIFAGAVCLEASVTDLLNRKAEEGPDAEGPTLFFVADQAGTLVAFPEAMPGLLGLGGPTSGGDNGTPPLNLRDAAVPGVARAADDMAVRNEGVIEISPGGAPHIFSFSALSAVNLYVCAVTPAPEAAQPVAAGPGEAAKGPLEAFPLIFVFALGLILITGVIFLIILSAPSKSAPKRDLLDGDADPDVMDLTDDDFWDDEADMFDEDDLDDRDLKAETLKAAEGEAAAPASAADGMNDGLSKLFELAEQSEGGLSRSYDKMLETMNKVHGMEKRHSIELAEANDKLQKEIHDRKRAEREIRHLSSKLISGIEENRKNLARDLHDEFGQTLAALHMDLETLHKSLPDNLTDQRKKTEDLIARIEELGDSIRNLSSELRPDLLDDLGLVPALKWYITEFSGKRPEIKVEFQSAGVRRRFSPEIELVIYRIFQEGINNIVKHAKARRVEVTLTYSHPKLIFVLKDDGVGFERSRSTDGIGLLGMRERVISVRGGLHIQSARSKGTTIRVEIPVA